MTRAELLSLIMYDIGLPLISAIIKTVKTDDQEKAVADMAALLERTIDQSEEIQSTLVVSEEDMKNIYVRISMAALSSQLVSAQYEQNGKLPSDSDMKRSVSSMDALQAFADRYGLIEAINSEYKFETPEARRAINNMVKLTYLEYFSPLADAIGTFSFGETETKMMQNVSEKLRNNANKVRIDILGDDMPDEHKKAAELSILKVVVELYSSCHKAETARIMALPEGDRSTEKSEIQIENIWAGYEKRLSMLSAVTKGILPDDIPGVLQQMIDKDPKFNDEPAASADQDQAPPAQTETKPDQPEPAEEKPAEPEQDEKPAAPPSPMSFYSKKDSDE